MAFNDYKKRPLGAGPSNNYPPLTPPVFINNELQLDSYLAPASGKSLAWQKINRYKDRYLWKFQIFMQGL